MLKKLSLFLTLIFILNSVSLLAAPKPREFNLKTVKSKVVNNSLYNEIEFLDSRPLHEDSLITINDSIFTSQLQTRLDNMIDQSAQNNILLLQIRHLQIEEANKDVIGLYAYMDLYQKKDDRYFLLNTINRRCKIKETEQIDDVITQSITELILNNLKNESISNISYLDKEIEKIDSIEKSRIKAYQTDDLVDGVYATYEEFAAQTPYIKIMDVKIDQDLVKDIKVATNGGTKMQKIDLTKNYAVVVDHIPYLIFKKKYFRMIKEDEEFIIKIKKIKVKRNFLVVSAGLLGPFAGGLANGASRPNVKEETTTYMINHLDGEVLLKEKTSTQYHKDFY